MTVCILFEREREKKKDNKNDISKREAHTRTRNKSCMNFIIPISSTAEQWKYMKEAVSIHDEQIHSNNNNKKNLMNCSDGRRQNVEFLFGLLKIKINWTYAANHCIYPVSMDSKCARTKGKTNSVFGWMYGSLSPPLCFINWINVTLMRFQFKFPLQIHAYFGELKLNRFDFDVFLHYETIWATKKYTQKKWYVVYWLWAHSIWLFLDSFHRYSTQIQRWQSEKEKKTENKCEIYTYTYTQRDPKPNIEP